MELVENGFPFNSLGQVTNRLVFMVAEALLFSIRKKCFASAYDVSVLWKLPLGGYYRPIPKTRTGKSPSGAHHP